MLGLPDEVETEAEAKRYEKHVGNIEAAPNVTLGHKQRNVDNPAHIGSKLYRRRVVR